MPYDLYGTYYASRQDALNAETAQCAEIDADYAIGKLKQEAEEIVYIWEYIKQLEKRISALENKFITY